jgi:hypothetical protein
VVAFSISDEEHRRLRVAAARKGLPMSKFSRACVLRQIALPGTCAAEQQQLQKEEGQ